MKTFLAKLLGLPTPAMYIAAQAAHKKAVQTLNDFRAPIKEQSEKDRLTDAIWEMERSREDLIEAAEAIRKAKGKVSPTQEAINAVTTRLLQTQKRLDELGK